LQKLSLFLKCSIVKAAKFNKKAAIPQEAALPQLAASGCRKNLTSGKTPMTVPAGRCRTEGSCGIPAGSEAGQLLYHLLALTNRAVRGFFRRKHQFLEAGAAV